jgi:HPt (histidine-containing phosphotransfer) domain-containing protein
MTDFDARMAELRARFLQEAGKERERLIEAFRDDDHAAMRRIAHSLSGRAGMFGFPEVSERRRRSKRRSKTSRHSFARPMTRCSKAWNS